MTLTGLAKVVREYSREISICAQIPMDRLLTDIYGLEVKLAAMFANHELTQPEAHAI